MLEIAVLPPGLLVLASFFLFLPLGLQGGATVVSHDQKLNSLCQYATCNLAVLSPGTGFLAFYHDAGR